eukprot:ANDGO_03822.mRNA.1 hypothetical protein
MLWPPVGLGMQRAVEVSAVLLAFDHFIPESFKDSALLLICRMFCTFYFFIQFDILGSLIRFLAFTFKYEEFPIVLNADLFLSQNRPNVHWSSFLVNPAGFVTLHIEACPSQLSGAFVLSSFQKRTFKIMLKSKKSERSGTISWSIMTTSRRKSSFTAIDPSDPIGRLLAGCGALAHNSLRISKSDGEIVLVPKLEKDAWLFGNEDAVMSVVRHFSFVIHRPADMLRYGVSPKAAYLFAGPVGSGKSTAIRYIASILDLPLHTTTLTKFSSDSLVFSSAAILVVEDVHVQSPVELFQLAGVKNQADRDSTDRIFKYVNRMTEILQILDGLETPHGLLCIFTANFHSVLETAIDIHALLRPLRLKCISFDYPRLSSLQSSAPPIYKRYIRFLVMMGIRGDEEVNIAQLKECIVLAESQVYKSTEDVTLEAFSEIWNNTNAERESMKKRLTTDKTS